MRRAASRLAPRLLQAAEGAAAPRAAAAVWMARAGAPAPYSPVMAAAAAGGMRGMSGLPDILRKELDYERKEYSQPEVGAVNGTVA